MRFLKLHGFANTSRDVYFVNPEEISLMVRDRARDEEYTYSRLKSSEQIEIKETPEQIMKLVDRAYEMERYRERLEKERLETGLKTKD